MLGQWLQRAFLVVVGACGPWVGVTGCKGSEHVVLAPIIAAPSNASGGSSAGGSGGSSPMDGGNSQPTDASDQEPDATDSAIDSGLDPNVTFQWVQTRPGPGTCGPNTFVGSFSCTSESRLTPFVGQITIVVSDTGLGESTLGVTGKLADAAGLELFFSANIQGSLDCTTNQLAGTTTDGRAAYFGVEATFETAMMAEYDPQTLEMIGELTLSITYDDPTRTETEACRGSFQVGAAL